MNIRVATAQDADSLVQFNQAMARETEGKHLDGPTVKSGVNAVFEDENKGFYVVAEDDSGILGGLMVTLEWSDWRSGWFWWIQSVYIRPEARGKRIYSKLYEFVKEQAASESDVCGFRLYVETENHHAQTVYKKLGMSSPRYIMFEEEI